MTEEEEKQKKEIDRIWNEAQRISSKVTSVNEVLKKYQKAGLKSQELDIIIKRLDKEIRESKEKQKQGFPGDYTIQNKIRETSTLITKLRYVLEGLKYYEDKKRLKIYKEGSEDSQRKTIDEGEGLEDGKVVIKGWETNESEVEEILRKEREKKKKQKQDYEKEERYNRYKNWKY